VKVRDANDVLKAEGADALRSRLDKAIINGGDAVPSVPQATSLKFTLYRDIGAAPRKQWLVRDILGAGELSCWFGAPGSGKSVLMTDLAGHVAAGLPWFGRTTNKCAVLYIALERAGVVKRRFAAFQLHHRLADLPIAIVSGSVDLRAPQDADAVIEQANRLQQLVGLPVGLVIVDTVSRALRAGDENSPKDMGALVANFGRIQDATAAHLATVHHVPVDAQRLRGHGLLLAANDTTVHVEKTAACRSATVDKANDGPEGERVAFTLSSVTLDVDEATGETTTAPAVVPVDNMSAEALRPARLPKAAQTALRALHEAATDVGTVPPASNHIPQGLRVVTADQWRQYAYRMGISTGEERAKQQAFKRATEYLIAGQYVGAWDNQYWPA
jgi:hypothetical protein